MSSDSECVDNPEVPEVPVVKRKVFPKRKALKPKEIEILLELSSSEGEDAQDWPTDDDLGPFFDHSNVCVNN